MGMQGGCVVVQAGAAPLRSWVHPLLLGREEEYDPEEDFEVDKLLDHRQCKGRREYLVRWVGTDPAGKPWDNWWLPENQISDHLIAVYTRRLNKIEAIPVTIDLQPVLHMVRKSCAHAVMLAKTRCRPRLHELTVEALCLEPLARAFLEQVSRPLALNVRWPPRTRRTRCRCLRPRTVTASTTSASSSSP